MGNITSLTSQMAQYLPANAGDTGDVGLISGSERSPGVGNGIPLQYPCPENPTDRGAWQVQCMGLQSQT